MLRRWNQKGSCLSHDPLTRTKNALVLILSQELYELCSAEGREGGETATSNYLGMRSLFGSISSRLWPRETQPSSTTGCVISSLRPPQCTRTFFSGFGRGTFCPAVFQLFWTIAQHSNSPSDRPFTSRNENLILDVSAEGNIWCMHVMKTALQHVVNKLSSPFALKWSFCCFLEETTFCI